jgi:hypothetical protein
MRFASARSILVLLPLLAVGVTGCLDEPDVPRACPIGNLSATGIVAGAVPLGATTYPVPTGARFVSPTGSDAAAGLVGSPWRTLVHAVATAPSGATIVLRAGTYREMVEARIDKRFTFQPYPNEVAWLSGSRAVTGWIADGNAWRKDGWTARFSRDWVDPNMIDPAHPMAAYPDQAFLDGSPLRQVGSRSEVVPGAFYLNERTSELWIGNDPTDHTVEASVVAEGLHVQAPDSVIRGLGFKHFANPLFRLGAVKVLGARTVVENNHIVDNATAGLSVIGPDVLVRRNTLTRNGQLGVHGHDAHRMRLESNVVSNNNAERFITWQAAGGVKVTESTDIVMRDNVVDDNHGHGLWFDLGSHRATVVHNVTRRNASAGIFFEISDTALIAGNVSTDNVAGIQAGESSDVEVWNNVLVDNAYALKSYKGWREPNPVGFKIRNNVISTRRPSGLPQVDNDDVTGSMTWRQMGWSSDHNAFYRRSSVTNEFFTVLADGSGRLHYKALAAVVANTDQEHNSFSADNVAVDPFVVDASSCQYGLPAGSVARGRGLPLPPNVATALGLPAGGSVNIGVV